MTYWGLLCFTVGAFASALLFDVTATRDTSAWYFENATALVAIVVGLASWAFYTAMRQVTPAFSQHRRT